MKIVSFIVNIIIALIVFLVFPALLLIKLPPRDITPRDLNSLEVPYQNLNKSTNPKDYNQWTGADINNNQFDYYVIIGSFKNPVQAKKRAKELGDTNNAEIIILDPNPEGYTRISYGKYSTRGEAESVIGNVKEKINPQAWILAVEK